MVFLYCELIEGIDFPIELYAYGKRRLKRIRIAILECDGIFYILSHINNFVCNNLIGLKSLLGT